MAVARLVLRLVLLLILTTLTPTLSRLDHPASAVARPSELHAGTSEGELSAALRPRVELPQALTEGASSDRSDWSAPGPSDPHSLYEMLLASAQLHSALPAFGYLPVPGGHARTRVHVSYAQFERLVGRLARGLSSAGLKRRDRLLMLLPNSVHFAALAYAANALGAVYCSTYPQANPAEWLHIVRDSDPRVLVLHSREQLAQLEAAAHAAGVKLPRMRVVIVGDAPPDADVQGLDSSSAADNHRLPEAAAPLSWAQLLKAGDGSRVCSRLGVGRANSLCALVYTSGTTGLPKGVCLSNWNILSNVLGAWHIGSICAGERTASFLPWSHAFGATLDLHFMLGHGVHINLISQTQTLAAEAQAIRPHVLLAVPRIWNTLFERTCAAMSSSGLKRLLFREARAAAEARLRSAGYDAYAVRPTTAKDKLLDALVWRQVRARLGGELRLCISGAAPLSPAVLDFVRAMGVTLLEGYGLTETSPLVAGNGVYGRASCERGTVGHPLPGVRLRIDAKAWEGAQTAGEGELVVFGPCVMAGYWRNARATREVFTPDGGFRTGDTAVLSAAGHLRITGRLKEQFKLQNGRYVSPALLEEALRAHPAVATALVDGRGKAAPFAVIVPHARALASLLAADGVHVSPDAGLRALCAQPRASGLLLEALRPLMASAPWRPYERLQAVLLDPDEWSVANGKLTPSLKTKRQPVLARHADAIAAIP